MYFGAVVLCIDRKLQFQIVGGRRAQSVTRGLDSEYRCAQRTAGACARFQFAASAISRAIWQVADQVQLEAGGRNLSDKLYVFEEGLPEPGRTWFVNLNAVF